MNRQTVGIVKSLFLVSSLALGLAGCSADPGPEAPVPAQQSVRNELVTAEDVAELAPGEKLRVDVTDNLVLRFDYSKAPIDFGRVELAYADQVTSLQDARSTLLSYDYGSNEPVDLANASDSRFSVAMDPADFGSLSEGALSELEETGYVYREEGGTDVKPQSEDPCIYAVCVVCPWGWGNGPCFEEQHVWCD
jgi:hypothetical protein